MSIVEDALDHFAMTYSEELNMSLLKILAYPSQGGLGYEIKTHNPWIESDGWHVDDDTRTIYVDTHGFFGQSNGAEGVASQLENAIQVHFLGHASVLSRFVGGTAKVLLGVVETTVGLVGIVTPEPGTTVGGVALTVLGTNTVVDGVTQLAGANDGHGVNLLSDAFGAAGAGIADLAGLDPQVGEDVGRGVFFVSSIVVGTAATIRVLHAPGAALRLGVGGQPGGLEVGRLHLLMPSQRAGGMTLFSIVNNQGQSFLRFVFQGGNLYVNARIVDVSRLLVHETSWRLIARELLRLLWHGAKTGL